MEIQASLFSVWNVFFFLELYGAVRITNPQYRSIRLFLGFCALRSAILFALSGDIQAYWDLGWFTKEIEMVWLALIAGQVVSFVNPRFRLPMRLPAFGIATLSFHYLWAKGWPFRATPLEMQTLQQSCQLLILATVVIGCGLVLQTVNLRLAASVATLAASGLVSAQSFLAGNFHPTAATAIWILGLLLLLTAVTGISRSLGSHEGLAQSESRRPALSEASESMPTDEAYLPEWTTWPCHTRIQ